MPAFLTAGVLRWVIVLNLLIDADLLIGADLRIVEVFSMIFKKDSIKTSFSKTNKLGEVSNLLISCFAFKTSLRAS